MPNTQSAKKRHEQSLVRRTRNRATKSELKTLIRKVVELLKADDSAAAETQFRLTVKKLDKAAAHRVIHPNRAARVKARLSSRLKGAKQGAKAKA